MSTGEKVETAQNNYLMHYVGNGLYNTKRFIAEAKRIGVQRAIQFNLLRGIKWGQPILVAQHKKIPQCIREYHDMPAAGVFGYFKVDTLSYHLDPDVREKLMQKIEVLDISIPSGPVEHEQRACGDYGIGPCIMVNDSIEQLVEKIEQACTECNKKPNQFKYFLKGQLVLLDAPVILEHTKFNRGYRRVTLEGLKVETVQPKKGIFFLYDYERRAYMTRDEERDYDKILVEEHIEGTT